MDPSAAVEVLGPVPKHRRTLRLGVDLLQTLLACRIGPLSSRELSDRGMRVCAAASAHRASLDARYHSTARCDDHHHHHDLTRVKPQALLFSYPPIMQDTGMRSVAYLCTARCSLPSSGGERDEMGTTLSAHAAWAASAGGPGRSPRRLSSRRPRSPVYSVPQARLYPAWRDRRMQRQRCRADRDRRAPGARCAGDRSHGVVLARFEGRRGDRLPGWADLIVKARGRRRRSSQYA